MSATLAKLTDESEQDTKAIVNKLEQLSGFASEDVRLTAEYQQNALRKIASLGLDPLDTTAEELYETLQVKLASDAKQFAKAINYDRGSNEARAAKVVELAITASPMTEVFAIKNAAAKNLLRSSVPTRLMKKLNYRSLESMLKREDICELYAVLPVTESHSWQKTFAKKLTGLKASDFETRDISYHVMAAKKWGELFITNQPVSYAPLSGAVAVWPVESLSRPESACFSILVLQAAEILEVDSLYLKNYQFQPEFGALAGKLYETGEQQTLQIDGQPFFDWQNLKHMFGSHSDPLKAFTSLHPTFSWWKDAGHTVSAGGELVSAHLADVLSNMFGSTSFNSRQLSSGTSSLKSSLLKKYLPHQNVANYFHSQLDDTNSVLEPATAEQLIGSELEAGLI